MNWIKQQEKPKRKVIDPNLVGKKKKPKNDAIFANRLANIEAHKAKVDVIPPGTLCHINKVAREMLKLDFSYCTLLSTVRTADRSKTVLASVLSPDGQIHQFDVKYLRNDHVQNGNIDEE